MKISKLQFIHIWNSLYEYNMNSKELTKNGVVLFDHDKHLYDLNIFLLKMLLTEAQVDFIIFSIFSDNKYIEGLGNIDNAEDCYKYITEIDNNIEKE